MLKQILAVFTLISTSAEWASIREALRLCRERPVSRPLARRKDKAEYSHVKQALPYRFVACVFLVKLAVIAFTYMYLLVLENSKDYAKKLACLLQPSKKLYPYFAD